MVAEVTESLRTHLSLAEEGEVDELVRREHAYWVTQLMWVWQGLLGSSREGTP